jgi:general secretion pathway protein H
VTSFTQQKGFTILELLVVLTIGGMLVTLVPPMFSKGVSGVAFKGAARSISASLRSARVHAISKHKDIEVDFNLEDKTYQIVGFKKKYALPDDIEISVKLQKENSQSDNTRQIRFFADGGATGGQVVLSKDQAEYVVAVDWLTGQVKILE